MARFFLFLLLTFALPQPASAWFIDEFISPKVKTPASLTIPKLYTASHILVVFNGNEEEALSKAMALYKRSVAGEDFYDLAYYNSDDKSRYVGGSLGSFHRGQVQEDFGDALVELNVGEISRPVKSEYGYHIIKRDK